MCFGQCLMALLEKDLEPTDWFPPRTFICHELSSNIVCRYSEWLGYSASRKTNFTDRPSSSSPTMEFANRAASSQFSRGLFFN